MQRAGGLRGLHATRVSGMDPRKLARPERFELPTPWFVARYSIQLSYGRVFLRYDERPDRRPAGA
jgi:hypothetical protein